VVWMELRGEGDWAKWTTGLRETQPVIKIPN
jgi:hypothetical protein